MMKKYQRRGDASQVCQACVVDDLSDPVDKAVHVVYLNCMSLANTMLILALNFLIHKP